MKKILIEEGRQTTPSGEAQTQPSVELGERHLSPTHYPNGSLALSNAFPFGPDRTHASTENAIPLRFSPFSIDPPQTLSGAMEVVEARGGGGWPFNAPLMQTNGRAGEDKVTWVELTLPGGNQKGPMIAPINVSTQRER